MSKLESGWYRVWFSGCENPVIMLWNGVGGYWQDGFDVYHEDDEEIGDFDPKMVMTPSGQIVYNQPAHDPLYNTKQEG
ncbi:MAG: hypothetical protein ACRCXB_08905 [Aeromonadaceae bacterium]